MEQSAALGFGLVILFVYLGIIGLFIVAAWKLNTKAGKPGWACLVPIYNLIVNLEIVGRPAWHLVFFLIPFYNFIFIFIFCSDYCKSYGRNSVLDVILFVFFGFIYLPYMAFSDSVQYVGPHRHLSVAPSVA